MIRINLLPRERVQRRPIAPRILLVLVGAVLLVVVTGATLWLNARNAVVRAEVARVNKQIDALRPRVARVEALRKAIEEARRKADLLKNLEASRVPWAVILEELRTVLPKDVWLVQMQANDDGSLTFSGFGMSYTAVARFMVSLEDSALFEGVDMVVSQKQNVAGRDVINFALTGKFIRPAKEASVR
jgi:Tfp pilus assembly protein PilN